MNLWRLELLRLTRTNRLLVLLAVYSFFGVTGPLTARYLREILDRFGGIEGITADMPAPVPADGIAQFASNASQLGLLAVIVVAAGALLVDAKPEMAIFLRTRVRSSWQLLAPRLVVPTAAAIVALVVGTVVAGVLTATLIGTPDLDGLAFGTLYGALYLVFAVTVTAIVASQATSVIMTVLGSVATLLALPVLGLFGPISPWLPSRLVGAAVGLVSGESAGDYWQAAVVTVVVSAALAALATRRVEHREL